MVQTLYIFLCCIPASILGYQIAFAPSANPVEQMMHFTGDWALHLLLLTLLVSPIRTLITHRLMNWVKLRRTLGLAAFAYACMHLLIFVIFDLELNINALAHEVVKRKYILVGFVALLILLPLAVTSTHGWQRRLKRNWLRIHKGVYVATALACLHYFMLVKADYTYPLVYTSIFVVLMLFRIKKKYLFGMF